MIEVKNLVKRYGSKVAVNGVSFTVNDGEILGFLGPNGAGKSTTMNIITGYLSSTEGTVTIDGSEILDDPIGAKAKIGYLPEQPPLYTDMTVSRYLSFMYDLKKVTLPKEKHIKEVSDLCGVSHVSERVIKNLSKGYRQRVGLAQALLGNPQLLILDEPTVGLDPKQIIEIRNLIKGLGKKHTVILSSHILPEVQAVCDRIVVINEGKIVADGKTDDLSANLTGEHRLSVAIEGREQAVYSLLKGISGMTHVEKLGEKEPGVYEYIVESAPEADIRRALFHALARADCPLLSMRSAELSLEEIFLRLTSGATPADFMSRISRKEKTEKQRVRLAVDVKDGEPVISEGEEAPQIDAEPKEEGGEDK